MDKQETVLSWIDVGKSKDANKYIHPAGSKSDEEYWFSGRYEAQSIQQKIGVADSILEFGCGNGRILRNIDHPHVYGVDISPELIAGLENAYLVSEFTKIVDAIYSISVFIHLKRIEAIEALKWIYEHLSPNGKAYLQIPIYEADRDPYSFIDVGVWCPAEFIKCINQVGFEIEQMWVSAGLFSYDNIGLNHNELQVLTKM